jgi:uncharacterized protein (TIGR03382 family)
MRLPTLPTATAFALLSSLLVGCAADARDDGRIGKVSSAVQGGKTDTTTAHNFAVGIANKMGGVCTGTLIAPNLVLTARHCVIPPSGQEGVTCADTFPKSVAPSNLFITTEPNLYRARAYYQAKEIVTPKETGFCGNDIALITLEENIPDSVAQPATPVVQFSMTDRSKINGTITAMGYGITSPSANDSGQRRIRQDIDILCIPGDKTLKCDGQYGAMVDSDKEFVTAGWVCSGDSGGGAYDQKTFDEGTPYVLGALSRGPQTADKCLAAIYTRTDAHAEMIMAAGQKAAELGGYTAPQWATPLPPPEEDPSVGDTDCNGETCMSTSATEPETTTVKKTTTSGCATSPISTSNGLGAFAAFAFVGLAALVARRRRS